MTRTPLSNTSVSAKQRGQTDALDSNLSSRWFVLHRNMDLHPPTGRLQAGSKTAGGKDTSPPVDDFRRLVPGSEVLVMFCCLVEATDARRGSQIDQRPGRTGINGGRKIEEAGDQRTL